MRPRYYILLGLIVCIGLLMGINAFIKGKGPDRKAARNLAHSPGNTTYYLESQKGDDHNPGTTPEKPWKSLDRVNATLFAPGDRILLKAGSRFSGQLHPQGSGKAGSPIVIDMYGVGDKPLIEAGGRYNEALLLENQEYWEANNLELTNHGRCREDSVTECDWWHGILAQCVTST